MSTVNAIVRTRSLRGGHYRAGLKHEAEPGDIPPGTITEEQLARLRADPDVEVEIIDPPQEPPQPRKKKPAGSEAGAAGDPAPDLGAAMTGEGTAKAQAGGEVAPGPAEAAGGGEDEDFGFDDDPETPEAKPEAK